MRMFFSYHYKQTTYGLHFIFDNDYTMVHPNNAHDFHTLKVHLLELDQGQ